MFTQRNLSFGTTQFSLGTFRRRNLCVAVNFTTYKLSEGGWVVSYSYSAYDRVCSCVNDSYIVGGGFRHIYFFPSGVTAIPVGSLNPSGSPTYTIAVTVFVALSITDILSA